nr:MAG TPA: hypothetical protein [Caudoviricetes sp.]
MKKQTYVCYNQSIATLVCATNGERCYMDYKSLIIEMLDKADERKLRLIYCYIKAILGLG